jgi:hypothetical protein
VNVGLIYRKEATVSEYGSYLAKLAEERFSGRRASHVSKPAPTPEEERAAKVKKAAENAERAARAKKAAEKAEREARAREAAEKAEKQEAIAKAAVAALTEAGYRVSVTEVNEPGGKRIIINSEAPHSAGLVSTNVSDDSSIQFDFHAFPGDSCKAAREDVIGKMARLGVELTPVSVLAKKEPACVAVPRVRGQH